MLKFLLTTGASIVVVIVALLVFAEQLLCLSSPLAKADAIVVLGGEPPIRVQHGARLFTNGYAPQMILSGYGDCLGDLRELGSLGVSTQSVVLECDSLSTQQNALFTVKLLRARGCKSAIIVTSWFHSRRALNCFHKYAPEISFVSAPAPRVRNAFRYERGYIEAEYLKIVWYALRWRVFPWS